MITDFLVMLWNFVCNLFSGLITTISVLLSAVTLPMLLRGFVPSFIGTSVIIVGCIGVVKMLLGWGMIDVVVFSVFQR